MASYVAGGVTYLGLDAAPTGTGWATGRFWIDDVKVSAGLFDRRKIALPGVNGYRIKKYGSRGRMINSRVAYIGSSYATTFTSQQADRATFENQLISVTPPQGTQYDNCDLIIFPQDKVMHLGTNRFIMLCDLQFLSIE